MVTFEAEADEWNGDELIEAISPWLLASACLVAAVQSAALTGLRVGAVANPFYSEAGGVRARLGEFAVKELPQLRIAVPIHAVELGLAPGR